MLSKDLSTKTMNQEIQHPSEYDARKDKNKIKFVFSYSKRTRNKQPKPRARIIQLPNITQACRKMI